MSPALYFFRTLLGVLVDSPQNGIEFCPFSAHQRHWYRGIVKVIGTAGHIDHGKTTLIRELTGYRGEIVWDSSKPDGQPRRKLNTDRATKEFGFTSEVSFRDGLAETIATYEDVVRGAVPTRT